MDNISVSSETTHLVNVIARTLIAFVFVYGAFRRHFSLRFLVPNVLGGRGVPFPDVLIHVATVYQIIAGIMLAMGIWLLPVSISLIGYTLLASYLVLDFWNKEGMARIAAESGWQSNIGIIGGLMIVAVSQLPA